MTPENNTTLLAVVGMSPAVLTETVWALAHEPEPVVPSRIIAVTTIQGRQAIRNALFQPLERFGNQTAWQALRSSLERDGVNVEDRLRFGTTGDDIRVITTQSPGSGESAELQDLRSPSDNSGAADFLLEQVRSIVENPDNRLVASIAGGRKTMGALLYACVTLIGRETDRLTHVLVNEPFETLHEFYFPGQPGGVLVHPVAGKVCPDHAEVELANVPFVPLRNLFSRELGRTAGTFSRLVTTCRDNIRRRVAEAIRLSVDMSRTEIEINGTLTRLAPREHVIMLYLGTRAKQGQPPFASYGEALDSVEDFRQSLVASAPLDNFSDWRHADGLRSAFEEDQEIRRALSAIRSKIRKLGGDAALLESCLPEKGRFSLDVPAELIHLKS